MTAVEERDGAIVVRLAGELDLYNAHVVREALLGAAEREPGAAGRRAVGGDVHRLDRASAS